MDKVSIKLQGGIGNYLFQIAAAYAYSIDYSKEFSLSNQGAVKVHGDISSYSDTLLHNISFNNVNFPYTMAVEKDFHYSKIQNIDGSVMLSGYFQSEKYFKNHDSDIRKLFSYPTDIYNSFIKRFDRKNNISILNDNTCSIHVRRGDYLNLQDHHPTQKMDYYREAISKMDSDTRFVVFSDDIEWCKENFTEDMGDFIFASKNADYIDLALMKSCKNNIICNSTFSWWGAWLNDNSEKIIIAPSKWFGKAYSNKNINDIYCKDWIKI